MGDPRALLRTDPRARSLLVGSVACSVLAAALLLAWVLLLAGAIDAVFRGGDDLAAVTPTLVAMVALLGLRAAATWLAEVLAQRAGGRLRATTRSRLAAHLFAVGPVGAHGGRTGDVASTLTDGVEALDPWVTSYLPATALAVAGPTMVLALVAVLDPWSTLVLLFTGPMLLLLLAVIGGRTGELTRRRLDELGWLSSFFLDMLRGLGTLKAFGRSEDGAEMIEDVSRRFGDTTMEVLRTAFQTSLVMEWAATAATALVAVEVSFRLIGDSLGFGTALAVLVLTPEFFVPIRRMALEYHSGQAGTAAMARIDGVLALPVAVAGATRDPGLPSPVPATVPAVAPATVPATVPAPGPVPTAARITVDLRDVTVTYPGADRPALHGLSLHLGAGQTVALVGPSGAGKTTVANLLLGFVTASAGVVEVGGAPLHGLDLADWRRQVAWVPQSPTVFAGTVADNIRLGDATAPMPRVEAAARLAGAAAFIEELPDGYDTVLGEAGLRLSGGQRQRLAIARAFLRDAPLVVLDEFTAQLDPGTEAVVLAALDRLLEGRTALVIAHRLRTILAADRVVVLEGGRVVEQGTHDGLIGAGGAYARLVADPRGLLDAADEVGSL